MKYPKQLVEIVWLDAETTHGWESDDETDLEQVPVTTIGFLIASNEHCVVIASSVSTTVNNARIKIPKAMIQNVTELLVAKKKTKPPKPTEPEGEVK
jgi:hypothetical protein